MSADEIRRLAESQVLVTFCGKNHLNSDPCTDCFDHKENVCQDKEAIKAALLAYAATVERCEEVKNKFAKSEDAAGNEVYLANYILKGATTDERK